MPRPILMQPLVPGALGNTAGVPGVLDNSWLRMDGTKKGMGFLGPLPFKGGGTSTELSIGVNMDGKEMEIPSLVPTLLPEEIQHLLGGGDPHEEIIKKAVDHARMRIRQGLPVFAE